MTFINITKLERSHYKSKSAHLMANDNEKHLLVNKIRACLVVNFHALLLANKITI